MPHPRWLPFAIIIVASLIAVVSARPYAGSWNDGSRLASVEAIVDYRTFAIDDSVFVQVPSQRIEQGTPPYPSDQPLLLQKGTQDKLLIEGHFYSDKPPWVSVLMAAIYRTWRTTGGPTFSERPDLVCYFMTLTTSGLAFIVTVWSFYRVGQLMRLPMRIHLALLAAFTLGTMSLAYVQHVNNHMLFLAVMAAILVQALRLREALATGSNSHAPLFWLGTLGGLGYNLDLGLAPFLAVSLFALVVYRCRRLAPVSLFALVALPWVIAHHGLNYFICGSWIKPLNANPAFFEWPGSPFSATNMTGVFQHDALGFVAYSLDMLFGKKGLLSHNLPMFFALAAGVVLAKRRQWDAEMLALGAFMLGGWMSYAAMSNNLSGGCCSVRWFMPFLAGGYYFSAVYLKRNPESISEFLGLATFGVILGALMWWKGPWTLRMIPMLWPLMGCGLLAWVCLYYKRLRTRTEPVQQSFELPLARAA